MSCALHVFDLSVNDKDSTATLRCKSSNGDLQFATGICTLLSCRWKLRGLQVLKESSDALCSYCSCCQIRSLFAVGLVLFFVWLFGLFSFICEWWQNLYKFSFFHHRLHCRLWYRAARGESQKITQQFCPEGRFFTHSTNLEHNRQFKVVEI